MRSLIISTVVFFVASYFLHRYFENWGLDKGLSRTLLVLLLGTIISYGAASFVDWITGESSVLPMSLP